MRRLLLSAAALSVALAGAAMARTLTDGSDAIPTLHPAATARYQALLTPAQRRLPWLARFEGVAAPIHEVTVGGQTMRLGWACKPHDCGDNQVTVMFTPNGSRVVARITIAAQASFVGAPNAAEQACLSREHNTDHDDHC